MTTPLIEPSQFVAAVQPLLERQDAAGLLELVRTRWTKEQLRSVLECDDLDARKVACLALALAGEKCSIPCVASQLQHPDSVVNQMAEHALWSIWFRCGNDEANNELCRGTRALNRRAFDCAMQHFTRATELDPTFAEAYNQRAITKYLNERYEESIADCREAIERMPCHFGAWAGLGHCHAHQGRLSDALSCYERALAINPHLDGIREAITELKRELE
ncbi:MAG TPA: tetratricopeptide repeat protein [Tepidisphaeraceae bacterium]|jgi:tetratricopeptide (TPR) repeat protein|nr:tetratricopeptide repeat protein [Tepidisphaeraceae bacterium]